MEPLVGATITNARTRLEALAAPLSTSLVNTRCKGAADGGDQK